MKILPEEAEAKVRNIGTHEHGISAEYTGHIAAAREDGAREAVEWMCEEVCAECGGRVGFDGVSHAVDGELLCERSDGYIAETITRAEHLRRKS